MGFYEAWLNVRGREKRLGERQHKEPGPFHQQDGEQQERSNIAEGKLSSCSSLDRPDPIPSWSLILKPSCS